MSLFNRLPQFAKEFTRLEKKYRSLPEDLQKLEKVISINPRGIGVNFVCIFRTDTLEIIKTRLACRSLRARSIRVIYAYHRDNNTITCLEIYFKGDKANEDIGLIEEYIKNN